MDVSRETLVEPLEDDAKKPGKEAKFREVLGIGAVPSEAKSFGLSRVVKDGRENTGFEPMFLTTEDGVENRYFPITCLSTAWIREKFGPGRYRVTMRNELGQPRFGHRTVGVLPSKEEKAQAVEKRPPPRTPAELELERERMKLDFEMQTLKDRAAMQDRFFTEMKELLLSTRAPATVAPPVDVKAEIDRALAEERRYSELQTKLAVIEAEAGFDDGDEDETPARAPKLTDMERTLGTVKGILELAQPLLANPLIANAMQLLAAPYLEKLALSAQAKIDQAHTEHAIKRAPRKTQEEPAKVDGRSDATTEAQAAPIEGTIDPPAPKPSRTQRRTSKSNGAAPVRRKVPLRVVPPPPTPTEPGA